MVDIEQIREAAKRIEGKVHRTPILTSKTLGELAGVELFLKCECFQKTGSFKVRGALNTILSSLKETQDATLITVSAGNHAQAVAWAAREVSKPCVVVMPTQAPRSKIDAVKGYGAEVILHDDRTTLFDRLKEEQEARGAVFIHPFDDPRIVAGAGSVGLEIFEDLGKVDAVVVPVGGGGLMAGVTSAIKQISPDTRIIAVELEDGPGLQPALDAGKPVPVTRPATIADGMTPPFVGLLPMQIAQEAVDEIVGVNEEEILSAMRLLITRAKLYVEGSGAAATAAIIHSKAEIKPGSRVVSLVSGGNVDLSDVCSKLNTQ